MNANRNTTVLGVATILAAVANALIAWFDGDASTSVDFGTALAAIMAGIGLIKAADAKPTGAAGE